MIWILNRYSYLITSALVMGVAWLVGSRFGALWSSVAVAGTGVGLALMQRRLRGGGSDLSTIYDSESDPERRPPLLVFIYSDMCGACLVAQRMVDGLERELLGRVTVVRLNVGDPAGAEAQVRFQTTRVPTLILLDGDGDQVYRTEGKLPRRQAILEAVASSEG
jgi:hypothetical protein